MTNYVVELWYFDKAVRYTYRKCSLIRADSPRAAEKEAFERLGKERAGKYQVFSIKELN
jgi:hypothetical protein